MAIGACVDPEPAGRGFPVACQARLLEDQLTCLVTNSNFKRAEDPD
ncbi:MAG: hypothetical protein VB142_07865 [Burkholderia sp.]